MTTIREVAKRAGVSDYAMTTATRPPDVSQTPTPRVRTQRCAATNRTVELRQLGHHSREESVRPTNRQVSLLLLLTGLLVQTCTSRAPEKAAEPVKLKVVVLPYLGFAPFFIADEEGYFAEQGLEVEFVDFERTSDAIPGLLQGELDVAVPAPSAGFLNAIARGSAIRFVAGKGRFDPNQDCTYWGLLTRQELIDTGALSDPAGLRGRRIASQSADVAGYVVAKALQGFDLAFADMEIVNIPIPAQLEALQTGSVDLLFTVEPWVTRGLRTPGIAVWRSAQTIMPDLDFGVIAYGPSLLQENPDAGRRFMVAYLQGVRQLNLGKTERNLEILAQHTQLEKELLQDLCWPPIPNDASVRPTSIMEYQRWLLQEGLLDEAVGEEQFWEPSFLEYATRVLDGSQP